MKNIAILNIKGALINKQELKNYLEKIASEHILKGSSDKKTYPIPRLLDNFEYITKTYEMLNEHLKLGINVHQAGEWLLDNYYIIEETVKEVRKNLPLKKYVKFVGLSSGKYKGYARSYVLASEIVAYIDGSFTAQDLEEYLQSYQAKKSLNMDEIWDINLFFKIALIEKIREICTNIYSSQMQKLKVESIIERLVERKSENELKFSKKTKMAYENSYTFIEYMAYKLKQYGKKGIAYLNILEDEIDKKGLSINEVIKKEHFDIALKKVEIGNCIRSIHSLQRMNFTEIFEKINGVEDILKKDPSKIYENMDYKTKEYYRNRIKEIADKTKISEIYIAKQIVSLAKTKKAGEKENHIGYYLIDDGILELYLSLGVKTRKIKKETKVNLYIYGILILGILISLWLGVLTFKLTQDILISIIEFVLIFFPITEIITKLVQNILSKCVKPKLIPKMDFSKGIPKEYSTMIVIPSVMKNYSDMKKILDKLEVYYLANKSENIYCTALGDPVPSKNQVEAEDENIVKTGIYECERLNKKYGRDIFNFVYRKRVWVKEEDMYMGWERKRGMLLEFSEFLNSLGDFKKKDMFYMLFKSVPKIRYVITLDSDTDLVLNSGIELIEGMAHILNKPVVENGKVISGHRYNSIKGWD